MNEKTLFAGPWIGEFGWELFCWQGFIRKLAKQYARVIVVCRTGHDLLYRDFATDIVHHNPAQENTDMWHNRGDFGHNRNFSQYYVEGISSFKVIPNDTYRTRWWLEEPWAKRQNLIPFGVQRLAKSSTHVLIIVRDTDKCGTAFRNWPLTHAAQFVEKIQAHGFTVACVGKSDSALWVPGTIDCRDVPLDQLADIMTSALVIVGPQCGPTHFASLCQLPQVCWQTRPEHAERAKNGWNPFHTSVATISSDSSYWKKRALWLPPVDDIVDTTLYQISERSRDL